MTQLIILLAFSICILSGCERKTSSQIPPKVMINEGDSFEMVFDKLGEPNIDSSTQSSRVLIYEEIEIKLQSNVVVAVFDHR
ncbi:MAG: hypothetical protein V3V05_10655 [Pontiella sp.]